MCFYFVRSPGCSNKPIRGLAVLRQIAALEQVLVAAFQRPRTVFRVAQGLSWSSNKYWLYRGKAVSHCEYTEDVILNFELSFSF